MIVALSEFGCGRSEGTVPPDYQFGQPVSVGHDVLDHLSFLVATRDGLVPGVLRHNDWGAASGGPPLGGGLHAQVCQQTGNVPGMIPRIW